MNTTDTKINTLSKKNKSNPGKIYVSDSTYEILKREKWIHTKEEDD